LSYPERVKARWGIAGKLPFGGQDGCLLCHSKEVGGTGTATRRFAQNLRVRYGLTGGDVDVLELALAQDKKNADDSDQDGFSDYDELVSHATNPSDSESHPMVEEGASGAGGSAGSEGVPGAGGTIGAAGGLGEEELKQCTPTLPIFPEAQYGCQLGAKVPGCLAFQAVLLSLSCLALQRRKARTRRRLLGARRWRF
jgi:hypothetical protein